MLEITNGIRSLENRDFDNAKFLFNKVISNEDLSSVAHAGLANCYARENNLTLAKSELEQSVKSDELSLLIYIAYGLIADQEGKRDEAENYFTQAIKIDPKSSYANLMLGSFLLTHENNEDAIHLLLQAKEFGGNKWVVNRNLAIAYLRKGKPYKAFAESILSFSSKPSKEGFKLLIGCFLRAFWIVLLIIFGICLSFFYFKAGTLQGVVVPTVALIVFEYLRYIQEKNRKSLFLMLLYFVLGIIYYFVFVR